MTVHDYTGSQVVATLTRDSDSGATTYSTQSWTQAFGPAVLYEAFVTDIRSAGDYRLKIDGVVVATVLGVAAAATGVSFAPSGGVELEAGEHDFVIECTSGAVTWYARGNVPGPGVGVGGAGWLAQAWGPMLELNSDDTVPGEHRFKIADDALVSGIAWDSTSSGSFTGQSWTLTFDVDVVLTGIIKRVFATADTYKLSIDGTDVAASVKPNSAANHELGICPAVPEPVFGGAHTFRIYPTASRRMVYDNGTTGTPSGSGASHTTGWSVWTEASGNKVSCQIWFRLPVEEPTSLTADATSPTTVDLDWLAPASGPTPDGYQYRVDGGSPIDVGTDLDATVTGLTPDTTYLFEVRSYFSGIYSDWVDVTESTPDDFVPLPDGGYRVLLEVGPEYENVFDVTSGDTADYGVILPLTLGWDIPDSELVLPVQASPCVLVFSVLVPDSTDELIDAIALDARVRFRMFVFDPDEPWQSFDGQVTQVNGQHVRRNATEWDWRIDVFASDVAGLDKPIGLTDPLDAGDLLERLGTIETELGHWTRLAPELSDTENLGGSPISIDDTLGFTDAMLAAGPAPGSTTGLAHLRQILKFAAAEYDPPDYFGDVFWRWLFGYDPQPRDSAGDLDPTFGVPTLRLRLARPAVDYPTQTVELDGDHVTAKEPRWTKLVANGRPSWGEVDGVEWGSPDGRPGLFVTTPFQDGGLTDSEAVRHNIGNLLFEREGFDPDPGHGWTALDGWRTRILRHLSYLPEASEPVRQLIVGDGEPQGLPVRPVVVDNLSEELRLDDAATILGTLAGVKLIIPPGGKFYLELKLRPELPPQIPDTP